jgi:hypothetical protein
MYQHHFRAYFTILNPFFSAEENCHPEQCHQNGAIRRKILPSNFATGKNSEIKICHW